MITEAANRWVYPHCPPRIWQALCRLRRGVRRLLTDQSDLRTTIRFLCTSYPHAGLLRRARLVARFRTISRHIECPHSEHEMLEVAGAILSLPRDMPGCIVEAGCYKGGSTAKLSLAAAMAGRDLVVFDSFEGLPDNDEEHYTSAAADAGAGERVGCFGAGDYAGSLEEVRRHIRTFGDLSCCHFRKGWFCNTMPAFADDVAVAYIDVDLVMSTRECITNLHRVLVPGGRIYSQDGHLVRIQELLADPAFWSNEVGRRPQRIEGLGVKRMVCIEFAGARDGLTLTGETS